MNAAFFPAGDVLLLFAVVGLVLFLVRKWSDKAILITAIILLIQPIEWYHYIMSLLNPAHALPDLGVGAMYSEVAEYTKAGNFLVEGRYYYALSDFYNSTKKDYFSRSAHGVITAKITYLFDLRK